MATKQFSWMGLSRTETEFVVANMVREDAEQASVSPSKKETRAAILREARKLLRSIRNEEEGFEPNEDSGCGESTTADSASRPPSDEGAAIPTSSVTPTKSEAKPLEDEQEQHVESANQPAEHEDVSEVAALADDTGATTEQSE